MLSTDVDLPRDYQAKFPDRCIRCRGDTFRETFRISTHDLRWASILVWWLIGKKASVEIPCCQSCKLRMRLQRWGGGLATLVFAFFGVFFFYPLVQQLGQPFARIAMVVLGLICISPVIIVQVVWPPVFDITSSKKSISYEFKNKHDALEFAELNQDAPWVEIS